MSGNQFIEANRWSLEVLHEQPVQHGREAGNNVVLEPLSGFSVLWPRALLGRMPELVAGINDFLDRTVLGLMWNRCGKSSFGLIHGLWPWLGSLGIGLRRKCDHRRFHHTPSPDAAKHRNAAGAALNPPDGGIEQAVALYIKTHSVHCLISIRVGPGLQSRWQAQTSAISGISAVKNARRTSQSH
jgi:hypothetical protein